MANFNDQAYPVGVWFCVKATLGKVFDPQASAMSLCLCINMTLCSIHVGCLNGAPVG